MADRTAKLAVFAAALFVFLVGSKALQAQASSGSGRNGAQTRVAMSQALSPMEGDHLKVTVVEVSYGPGGSSSPHSHPCPVVGYVVEGALRTQVKGEAEHIYKAGESFYEAANGVHQVSANASATRPAKFIACFVCDHEAPLSVAEHSNLGGK